MKHRHPEKLRILEFQSRRPIAAHAEAFDETPTVTTPFRLRHTPESAPNNITVTSDVWYSSWYVLNNSTQKFKLYIQGGSQSTPVLAADGTVTDGLWNYRNAGVITAARIYLRTLANHSGEGLARVSPRALTSVPLEVSRRPGRAF